MCTQSLHIKSAYRSRYFYPDAPSAYSSVVACGQCEQCRISARNDMYLRTVQEYNDCVSRGGKVAFVTFTYDEDHVPVVRYSLDKKARTIVFDEVSRRENLLSKDTIFIFRKSDFQTFMNSFRKSVERRLKSSGYVDVKDSVRYIVTSEYGTEFTQRSHYHALLFLNHDVVREYDLNNRSSHGSFMRFIQSLWSYGMVSASDLGLFVDNDFCCGYVSKYIAKGLDILKLSAFSRFFNFIKDNYDYLSIKDEFSFIPANDDEDGPQFITRKATKISYLKYFLRVCGSRLFVMKSKGFGLGLIKPLQAVSDDSEKLLKVVNDGISVVRHSKRSRLSYPRYILRKLFYNTRSDGTLYLSDVGLRVHQHLSLVQIDTSVRMFKEFDKSQLYRLSSDVLPFEVDSIPVYISDLFNSQYSNIHKLFIYSNFVRGKCWPTSLYDKVHSLLRHCNSSNYQQVIAEFSSLSTQSYRNELFGAPYYMKDSRPKESLTLIDSLRRGFPLSRPITIPQFDLFLDVWTSVTSYLRGSLLDYYKKINDSQKELRDIINLNKYCS